MDGRIFAFKEQLPKSLQLQWTIENMAETIGIYYDGRRSFFMRRKNNPCLTLIILSALCVNFISGIDVFAQSKSRKKSKTRELGWSLEKFEKNGKTNPKDNKQNDQKEVIPSDDETIRVNTDLIVNDVLVTNQNGNVISGLEKGDFVVTEDGVPQTVEIFSIGENASAPRSIVLILNYAELQISNRKNSIQAAKLLIDKLSPNDKMAIVTVDVRLWMNFTSDKVRLKKTLDSFETKNIKLVNNLEFETLLAVLNEMFVEDDTQQIVIFQSDGSEIVTLRPDKDAPYQISKLTKQNSRIRWESERKFGFSEIKEAIERSRATIYSIIPVIKFLGLPKKERLAHAKILLENTYRFSWESDKFENARRIRSFQPIYADWMPAAQTAMFKVAELSGGYTAFIEKPQDAETVYSNIFTTIKNRYVIGYYPTNQEQDGKLRNVKIEVRGHPEYIVTGRKTYLPR